MSSFSFLFRRWYLFIVSSAFSIFCLGESWSSHGFIIVWGFKGNSCCSCIFTSSKNIFCSILGGGLSESFLLFIILKFCRKGFDYYHWCPMFAVFMVFKMISAYWFFKSAIFICYTVCSVNQLFYYCIRSYLFIK